LNYTASNDNLPIHEEKNRGVYVKGLLEVYVSSVQEVYEVMKRGGASRVVAFTSKDQYINIIKFYYNLCCFSIINKLNIII